jgi:hypothetical protein
MITFTLGWISLVASCTIPQKWFNDVTSWRGTKLALAAFATGIFVGRLILLSI